MAGKYKVPRGTYDILPKDSYKWHHVISVFNEVAKLFNYREIVTPIFETSDLFERSVGDSSDIVQKEMYKFEDKKGRSFALRPEGTAPVVRAFVENSLRIPESSIKLSYHGPMFRYDRPQKGRYRQFYQFGIENIGRSDMATDAEVIALAYTFFSKLGLKNFQLEINSLGNATSAEAYDKALVNFFSPNLDQMCTDCQKRIHKNPKRLLDCKVQSCKDIAIDAPSMLNYLDEECNKDFENLKNYLDDMKIPYTVNPKIVRGLDYYTKTAFEFINKNLGAQSALCGGGRYDKLVEQLGGKETPGIGFAGGFERLLLSMEAENLPFGEIPKPTAFLVAIGEKAKAKAMNILITLWNNSISSDSALNKESLKAQMKASGKSGADFTLILGEDEVNNNSISIKQMETGEQHIVALEDLITELQKLN